MSTKSKSSGSETRRKAMVIGVRVDADLDLLLRDRAARLGLGHCELARKIIEQHLAGAAPVAKVARNRLVISDVDRSTLATLSRHAGRLTGALIQTAKVARLWGGTPSQREAIEHLIPEVRAVKAAVDKLTAELNR